jgi:hypothetical protein
VFPLFTVKVLVKLLLVTTPVADPWKVWLLELRVKEYPGFPSNTAVTDLVSV